MRKKKFVIVSMVLIFMLVLSGCGSTSKNEAMDSYKGEMSTTSGSPSVSYDKVFSEESFEDTAYKGESGQKTENKFETDRKLIKTVEMRVETKEFDKTIAAIESQVAELGGYIEHLDTYNGSSYTNYRSERNADMTIRVPKQQLNVFLETVEGVSNVVRRSESVEDVTLTYVDLESHKKVLEAEQDTLIELMKQAKEVSDIITIESRLSEVRYQLESMESQLRTFDNKIDYSTVYLNVDEVKELTPVEEQTILERIAEGFVGSLKDVGDNLVEFGIWFIVNIPYFVIWAVILVVMYKVLRLLTRNRKSAGKKLFRKEKSSEAESQVKK